VGSVFFSIEITATYFIVGNLWKVQRAAPSLSLSWLLTPHSHRQALFCATWCVFFWKTFHTFGDVAYFDATNLHPFTVRARSARPHLRRLTRPAQLSWELTLFIIEGALCGLASAFFVWMCLRWMLMRKGIVDEVRAAPRRLAPAPRASLPEWLIARAATAGIRRSRTAHGRVEARGLRVPAPLQHVHALRQPLGVASVSTGRVAAGT
jgi:hypothetical protein